MSSFSVGDRCRSMEGVKWVTEFEGGSVGRGAAGRRALTWDWGCAGLGGGGGI